jgi:hypothetical protein
MARLPWVDFTRAHPNGHLVAAVIVPTRAPQRLTHLRQLLNKLIAQQNPAADFATALVRVTDVAQIHCGFADKADADRLAAIVKAEAAPRDAPVLGWTTHRSFTLDASKEVTLAGALATPGDGGTR